MSATLETKTKDQLLVEMFLEQSQEIKEKGLPQPAPGFVNSGSAFRTFTATEQDFINARYNFGRNSGPV
jgi:hypothetical protein